MIPLSISQNLQSIRRRERIVEMVWGGARLVALVLGLFLAACLVDWLVDRHADTPLWLTLTLFFLQIVAGASAIFYFVVWPWFRRRLSESALALWVEEKLPDLRHRLITAVELNRPKAKRAGMSAELIDIVTGEAVAHGQKYRYVRLIDYARLKWAALTLAPIVLLAILAFTIWPETMDALLARQLLQERDIPRAVTLEDATSPIQPKGEMATLRIRARGLNVADPLAGEVLIAAQGQPGDRFPIEFASMDPDGSAIYTAKVPPSTADLFFYAWLGDGRLKQPGTIHFEPRPIVTEQITLVDLPAYVGLTPTGDRFTQIQGRGDVVGIKGSTLQLALKTQKPVVQAALLIYGPDKQAPVPKDSDDEIAEKFVRRLPLQLSADGMSAAVKLDLSAEETSFRIEVIDSNGFVNEPKPRRNTRLIPEEPPQVTLLKESFAPEGSISDDGSNAEFEFDIPITPLNSKVIVPYVVRAPYGVGQAWLLYRILQKTESGNDLPVEEPWLRIALPEVSGSDETGPFDPRRGMFQHTPSDASVPFHALPSAHPDKEPPRMLAGGRFLFDTAGVIDAAGNQRMLKPGEQIEYLIEVFADKDSNAQRPSARSEARVKTIVLQQEWNASIIQMNREETRLQSINNKQKTLFEE